jgi:hypothetical protein
MSAGGRLGVMLLSAVLIAGAAVGDPNSTADARVVGPTKFDYLVLASMADSPHPLALSGYRPAPRQTEVSDRKAKATARPITAAH